MTTYTKACGICGSEFQTQQWNAGFCSEECREENRKGYAYRYNREHYEPVVDRKIPEPYSTKNSYVVVNDPTGGYRPGSRLPGFMDTLKMNTDKDQYIPYGMTVMHEQTGELKKVHGTRLRKVAER